jgi:hypothetical protein
MVVRADVRARLGVASTESSAARTRRDTRTLCRDVHVDRPLRRCASRSDADFELWEPQRGENFEVLSSKFLTGEARQTIHPSRRLMMREP